MAVVKDITKKLMKLSYEPKLNKMIAESVKLLVDYEFEAAADNDKKILGLLQKTEKMGKLFGIKHKLALTSFLDYIKALDKVELVQRDSNECNESATLFSEDLINGGVTSRIFSERAFISYVNEMISLNVRMARLDSYRAIYDKYISKFDDYDKANSIRRLLSKYCGDISYENEVIPLLQRFDDNVRLLEEAIQDTVSKKKDLRKKLLKYVYNVISIADSVFYDLEKDSEIMARQIKASYGVIDKEIIELIRLALRKDRCVDEVKEWMASISDGDQNNDFYEVKQIIREIETGEIQESAKTIFEENTSEWLMAALNDKTISKSKILEMCIETEKTYKHKALNSESIKEKTHSLKLLYDVRYRLAVQKYWNEFNNALAKIPSSDDRKGVFFFHSDWNLGNGTYSLPILMEAKKRGFTCVPSSPITFDFAPCDDDDLNKLAGARYFETYTDKVDSMRWRYNWNIDIPNKSIEADGLNIYEPIFEVISRWQFTCFYNFETNAWARARTYYFINMFEKTFYQCELLERWAKKNGKPVRIVSTSPHVKTFAGYRIYCEEKGYKSDMEYICARSGYDDYFANSPSKTQTLAAQNMTKNLDSRIPIYGTKEGFEKYYENNIDLLDELNEKVLEWFSVQRSVKFESDNIEDDQKREQVLKRIIDHKNSGKKVYLMNGKLIFDLGVKYTKGCVHDDMSHWATHTVETIKKNKDILLIIKPHPHETRKELTMTDESIDTFRDIIKTSLSDNIIYLEGHLFRNIDLAQYADVGITWNSTSTLELAAMGLKVVMGDEWGYFDYPIGITRFDTIEKYEDFLNNPDKYKQASDLSDKAMMFLSYIGSNDINMKNPYTETTTSNYRIFDTSKIHQDAIDDYIRNGDARLEQMFDEVI